MTRDLGELRWLPAPPYLIDAADAERLVSDLADLGYRVKTADASDVRDERGLLTKLGSALEFYDYCQPNWDGFSDCLGNLYGQGLPPTGVVIEHADVLLAANLHSFVRCAYLLQEFADNSFDPNDTFLLRVFFVGTWPSPRDA